MMITNPMIVASAVSLVACGVLVWAEKAKASRVRIVSKTIASLAFIVVGIIATSGSSFGNFVVAGLVLGAIGDVALLGKSDKAFLAGLGAFLLGHIAYVVAIAQVLPPSEWLRPLAIVPTIIGAIVLRWLWPRLGDMKIPVIVYVLTIVTMVAGALAVWHLILTTGAVLFFFSDLAVARDKFVRAGFVNRAWGLPCYYLGQLFIAWSLLWG